MPIPQKLMQQLFFAAHERGQSILRVCRHESGTALAAIWILWDQQAVYLLSNAVTAEGRSSGLIHFGGRFSSKSTVPHLPIDLCGTMLPEVARMNVGLGADSHLCVEIEKDGAFSVEIRVGNVNYG
ncbi:MAG: hypothetical protein R2795_20150 [Saprospiraceae bacterium]